MGARRKQHGGRREGAGRKAKTTTGEARTEPIPVKVSPSELDILREYASARGRSLADFVRGELGLSNVAPEDE